jgi:hypothetical protein
MKTAFILLWLFLTASICAAQEKSAPSCSFRLEKAVFNLRLGMSPSEAQAALQNAVKIKIKKNGGRVFFQNFINKPAPAALNGVRAIYLRFFDLRLFQIEIFYENRQEWQTVNDFVQSVSRQTNLPAAAWENVKGRQMIRCDEFTAAADKILNPRVEFTDNALKIAFDKSQEPKNILGEERLERREKNVSGEERMSER